MFYYFDPIYQHPKQAIILKAISPYLSFNLAFYTMHHKFIFYDPKLKVYGGAFLQKKKIDKISSYEQGEEMREKEEVWLVDNLFFEVRDPHINASLENFRWHYEEFFKSLYEQFLTFAINKEIKGIFTFLEEEDHQDALQCGKWPFAWGRERIKDKILAYLPLQQEAHQFLLSSHIKEIPW